MKLSYELLTRGGLILFLCIATIALFNLSDRYRPIGENLLADSGFDGELRDWRIDDNGGEVAAGGGVLRIVNRTYDAAPVAEQVIGRPETDYVAVRAEVRYRDVEASAIDWQSARLLLVQQLEGGRSDWKLPHTAFAATGTSDWMSVEHVFWLANTVQSLLFRAQVTIVTGELEVRNLQILPMKERDGFTVLRYMLILLWLVAWVWIVGPLLSVQYRRIPHYLALLVGLAILAGSLTPHIAKNELRQTLWKSWHTVSDAVRGESAADKPAPVMTQPVPTDETVKEKKVRVQREMKVWELWFKIQKSGHFGLFLLLSLFVVWARPDRRWYELAGVLLSFAVIAEILQLFAVDRHSQPRDALINVVGVTAGLIVALAIRMFWRLMFSRRARRARPAPG